MHMHTSQTSRREKNNKEKLKLVIQFWKYSICLNVTMHFGDENVEVGGERVVIFSVAWKKVDKNEKNKSGVKSYSEQKPTNKQQHLLW